ncbi:Uncharacterised protein [Enterobacter cloacae]|nr:Uncharacterised protein [Enterobacter cloacae]
MQLESRKSDLIETQRLRTIGHFIFQVGTRPVQNRHKVVADGINTAGCQVTNALLIIRNPGITLTGVGFDIFVNRNTFHNRPG